MLKNMWRPFANRANQSKTYLGFLIFSVLLILGFQNCASKLDTKSVSSADSAVPETLVAAADHLANGVPTHTTGPIESVQQPKAFIGFKSVGGKIFAPNGQRFIVKGATMFDYLLVSFTVGGHPTGYAETVYSTIGPQLDSAQAAGLNLVRVTIDPEITQNLRDPKLSYPGELKILDEIIAAATARQIVTQLQIVNADFSRGQALSSFLAGRYKVMPYVWINPANEINCNTSRFSPDILSCRNADVWKSQMASYVSGIRKAGFINPIVINGTEWGTEFRTIQNIRGIPVDPNIVLGAHIYANLDTEFSAADAENIKSRWANLTQWYPVIVDEVGILNTGFSGAVPQYKWMAQFLNFVSNWCRIQGGSGLTALTWYAYIPIPRIVDPNSLRTKNGEWNDWGNIYLNNYLTQVKK